MNNVQNNDCGVAAYLRKHRGLLTRRWLRAVRQQMQIRPTCNEAVVGLIDELPLLFDELCAVLANAAAPGAAIHAAKDARSHARERWQQGFALEELYMELDLLQRCVNAAVREYCAEAASHAVQREVHEAIDRFFSAAIRNAIRQFRCEQERHVSDALAEREQALAAQRKSDERLRIAAEAAGLGIFEWDPRTGRAVWENARMYEITEQPEDRGPMSLQQFIETLVHPDDAPRIHDAVHAATTASADIHEIFRIRTVRSGAQRTIEGSGRFVPDVSGAGCLLVGTLADVTARVAAEEALKLADRRKDVFLATLAHELRNPLAPVINAASLLQRPGISAEKALWAHRLIDRHATHLAHLIDDLLDLSRIAAGKITLRKQPFNLKTAVDQSIEMNASAAAQRGHRIQEVETSPMPLYVDGDLTRITQIISNLLDNAVKYTGNGGHIRIKVDRTDHHACISVEDNGFGMDPDLIPSLFEMFEQERAPASAGKAGLGIGLTVARSLVEMHHGTIAASSGGRGCGSCFTVRLPLCSPPGPAVAEMASDPSAANESRRVLIVDDNADAATSLAMLLDDHNVRVATSGRQALEIARDFDPQIVLLDLGLPDISGYEVAECLRQEHTGSAVLIAALTGYGQPEDRERTQRAGFDCHIVKPARPEEIIALIRAA
ncbi:hybrid sensor histidine kinase/response regulator [Paraburkholderia sp.]|uniref:hybrid sensor histidine kinase/response regulator n=1 Tax=Paraburkholderia sp. TaxID=1926495 RepID=UPI002F3E9B53